MGVRVPPFAPEPIAKLAARPDYFVVSSLAPRCTSMYYLGARCGPSRTRAARPILRYVPAFVFVLIALLSGCGDAPQRAPAPPPSADASTPSIPTTPSTRYYKD